MVYCVIGGTKCILIFNPVLKGKNTYLLLTWIEDKDLEEVLCDLPEDKQYKLGRKAGKEFVYHMGQNTA